MTGTPAQSPQRPDSQSPAHDALLAAATRIETLLREELDTRARVRLHRDFSYARFGGALAQGIVVALLIWAGIDALTSAPVTGIVVKLGFASVLQGAAIAAFVAARSD